MTKPQPIVVKVDIAVGERDSYGGSTNRVKFAFEETVPLDVDVMTHVRARLREELKRQEGVFLAAYPPPVAAEEEL